MQHSDKRFSLFAPPPIDPSFARAYDRLMDTVTSAAMRLRVQCAIEHGISVFETEAILTSDVARPNFITITVRPLAIVDPFAESVP